MERGSPEPIRAYQSPDGTPGLVPVPKAGCSTPAQTFLAFFHSNHFDLHCLLSQAGLAAEQKARPFAVAPQQSGEAGLCMDS